MARKRARITADHRRRRDRRTSPTTRSAQEPEGTFVGTLNEDFAVEANVGDIFQLGNTSWRILKVERGDGARRRRQGPAAVDPVLARRRPVADGGAVGRDRGAARRRAPMPQSLEREIGLPPEAAMQIADYIADGRRVLGTVPTQKRVVLERFFDESGGMQMVAARAVRRTHQPRVGPGPAQALLPRVRLRAAGGRQRRGDRHLARPAAQLPAGRRLQLPAPQHACGRC